MQSNLKVFRLSVGMEVERVTDSNYDLFKSNPLAVLVASASWCDHCADYRPIVQAAAAARPDITFGEAVLDKGRLTLFKREYGSLLDYIPVTIVMRNGQGVAFNVGAHPQSELEALIESALEEGSDAHMPAGAERLSLVDGKYAIDVSASGQML